jgi:hypothetical protein
LADLSRQGKSKSQTSEAGLSKGFDLAKKLPLSKKELFGVDR